VDINILAENTTSALWTEMDWYYWNWCNWLQDLFCSTIFLGAFQNFGELFHWGFTKMFYYRKHHSTICQNETPASKLSVS